MRLKSNFEHFSFSTLWIKILTYLAAMLESVFSRGDGQVVKTCVIFKSMEVTLFVRVVFLVRVFKIGYYIWNKRHNNCVTFIPFLCFNESPPPPSLSLFLSLQLLNTQPQTVGNLLLKRHWDFLIIYVA